MSSRDGFSCRASVLEVGAFGYVIVSRYFVHSGWDDPCMHDHTGGGVRPSLFPLRSPAAIHICCSLYGDRCIRGLSAGYIRRAGPVTGMGSLSETSAGVVICLLSQRCSLEAGCYGEGAKCSSECEGRQWEALPSTSWRWSSTASPSSGTGWRPDRRDSRRCDRLRSRCFCETPGGRWLSGVSPFLGGRADRRVG